MIKKVVIRTKLQAVRSLVNNLLEGKLKKGLVVVLVVICLLPINLVLAAQVPRDFFTEVSKGNIPGHSAVHKGAHNPAVGTSWECVWDNGTTYQFHLFPTVLNISSDNVADTAGTGTGAWNVTIVGLDTTWSEINETIQLNGQNNVTTTNTYQRINFFYIEGANTTSPNVGTNTGIIYAGIGTLVSGESPNVLSQIGVSGGVGHGRALSSAYSVPVNKTAFLMSIYYSSCEDKVAHFSLHYRGLGDGWKFRDYIHNFRTDLVYVYPTPLRFEGCSDITICARVGTGTAGVGAGYDLVLVDNDVLGDAILDWSDGTTSGTTTKDPTIIFAIFLGVVLIALLALVIRSKR